MSMKSYVVRASESMHVHTTACSIPSFLNLIIANSLCIIRLHVCADMGPSAATFREKWCGVDTAQAPRWVLVTKERW